MARLPSDLTMLILGYAPYPFLTETFPSLLSPEASQPIKKFWLIYIANHYFVQLPIHYNPIVEVDFIHTVLENMTAKQLYPHLSFFQEIYDAAQQLDMDIEQGMYSFIDNMHSYQLLAAIAIVYYMLIGTWSTDKIQRIAKVQLPNLELDPASQINFPRLDDNVLAPIGTPNQSERQLILALTKLCTRRTTYFASPTDFIVLDYDVNAIVTLQQLLSRTPETINNSRGVVLSQNIIKRYMAQEPLQIVTHFPPA